MPPKKKPDTLQEISLRSVARLANDMCVDIERNFGGWKCPVSREKLSIVKMYFSAVNHLFNDLCQKIFDMYFMKRMLVRKPKGYTSTNVVKDKYLILELLMCDQIRTLNLSELCPGNGFCTDSSFWTNQLLKLSNVVELDIYNMPLSAESFQAIGDVCTHLRKIHVVIYERQYAPMEALSHILKCRELVDVNINFNSSNKETHWEYARLLMNGLPKLQHYNHFDHWLQWMKETGISISTPLPSMRKVHIKGLKSVEVGDLIRTCPNLMDIKLSGSHDAVNGIPTFVGNTSFLRTLSESSLQLCNLHLISFSFSPELTRLITSNCTNLTSLFLDCCAGKIISVNDIYTIGINCPRIEDLRIIDPPLGYYDVTVRRAWIQLHSPNMEEQIFDTTPRMFVHLKCLALHSNMDWDQRILPLILRHANNLTDISLKNILKPTSTSQDVLSELLNANALHELESLSLEFNSYGRKRYKIPITIASIERLLDCCPKLIELDLQCPMKSPTSQYEWQLETDMQRQNYDISFTPGRLLWDYCP